MVKDGAQPQKSNTLRKYLAEDVIYYELWIIDASLIRRVQFLAVAARWHYLSLSHSKSGMAGRDSPN